MAEKITGVERRLIPSYKKKLNQIAKLCIKVAAEAQSRYPEGYLFCERGRHFHVMSAPDEGTAFERQQRIAMSSDLVLGMDVGAW